MGRLRSRCRWLLIVLLLGFIGLLAVLWRPGLSDDELLTRAAIALREHRYGDARRSRGRRSR